MHDGNGLQYKDSIIHRKFFEDRLHFFWNLFQTIYIYRIYWFFAFLSQIRVQLTQFTFLEVIGNSVKFPQTVHFK